MKFDVCGIVIGKWRSLLKVKQKTMKKLLIGSAFVLSAAAIHATGSDRTKAQSDKLSIAGYVSADTTPTDTTKKDSLQYGSFAYNVKDTVPADTTKKDTMFASAVAYRLVTDTVPTDTTKKDTSFQAFALAK